MEELLEQLKARIDWHRENVDASQPYGKGLREGLQMAIAITEKRIEETGGISVGASTVTFDSHCFRMIAEILGVPEATEWKEVIAAAAAVRKNEGELQVLVNDLTRSLLDHDMRQVVSNLPGPLAFGEMRTRGVTLPAAEPEDLDEEEQTPAETVRALGAGSSSFKAGRVYCPQCHWTSDKTRSGDHLQICPECGFPHTEFWPIDS